jgi:hypothetical protein
MDEIPKFVERLNRVQPFVHGVDLVLQKSGGWAFGADCRRRRSTLPRQQGLSALPGRQFFNQLPTSRIPQDGCCPSKPGDANLR